MNPKQLQETTGTGRVTGENPRFCTTQWTVVLAAGGEGPQRDLAMERFCHSYWFPVYAFLRRRGVDSENARDLTQEFFAQLIEKNWLSGVERRDARFSTLLLTMLQRFQISQYRLATSEKRGGKAIPVDLAQAEQWIQLESHNHETPERVFERRIALAVLDAALLRLRDECRETGRSRFYETLSPFLSRPPQTGEYARAGTSLGINEKAVAVAVLRLRSSFRDMVREEVAAGLIDPLQVAEEMRHLARAL